MDRDLVVVKKIRGEDGEWWSGRLPDLFNLEDAGATADKALDAFYKGGFTIVLNRVNYRHPSVAAISEVVAEDMFGFRANCNLYASPPSSQGFEAHMDWMESFVLQLAGTKTWNLFEPLIHLPNADHVVKPRADQLEPTATLEMRPGDLLYIPSGLPHEATTRSNDPNAPPAISVHLTIGVEIDEQFQFSGLIHSLVHALEQSLLGDSRDCEARLLSGLVDSSGGLATWFDVLHATIEDCSARVSFGADGKFSDLRRAVPVLMADIIPSPTSAPRQRADSQASAVWRQSERLLGLLGEQGSATRAVAFAAGWLESHPGSSSVPQPHGISPSYEHERVAVLQRVATVREVVDGEGSLREWFGIIRQAIAGVSGSEQGGDRGRVDFEMVLETLRIEATKVRKETLDLQRRIVAANKQRLEQREQETVA